MSIFPSRSLRRKMLAAVLGFVGCVLLYEATVIESGGLPDVRAKGVSSGTRAQFVATGYCKGQTTASGVAAQTGVAAADPDMLPEGSVVQIDGVPERHRGIYTVLDTGPKVLGRHLDLYMWSCNEALAFGRRAVTVTILRRGWKPNDALPAASARRTTQP